jgi:starch phosphorylase
VLNLSILDGWWQEGFNGKNGWAIGENREYYNDMEQDQADGQSLYHLLENEVIPLFYNRDEKGIPRQWVQKMKESMSSIIPQFNTNRMVTEYMARMYVPAMKPLKKLPQKHNPVSF